MSWLFDWISKTILGSTKPLKFVICVCLMGEGESRIEILNPEFYYSKQLPKNLSKNINFLLFKYSSWYPKNKLCCSSHPNSFWTTSEFFFFAPLHVIFKWACIFPLVTTSWLADGWKKLPCRDFNCWNLEPKANVLNRLLRWSSLKY
jgi:hypothetical protein